MTSTNLTRSEAQQRSEMLSVRHYHVDLDFSCSTEVFPSKTTVHFEAKHAGDTFIDLRAAKVHQVLLDGADITPEDYCETEGIPLRGLSAGEHELYVDAECIYSHTGEGLHRFVDPADGRVYLYTQFETADAKRAFACFDQPDLKATYDLVFRTPEDEEWVVISNAPARVEGESNAHHVHVPTPLSTYLIAVCAGPYQGVQDTWAGELTHHLETPADQPTALEVPLGIYCRRSLFEYLDAERLFRETKQGFDFYHQHFGMAYPFGKYDQIFVPEFNAGAMENAGCVTITDEYIFRSQATHYRYERRADTILHELAHMWFGDLVTMAWWDDLWLNESFATWSAALSQAEATEYDTAWVTFNNVEKAMAYHEDQLPTTHPVLADASDIETVEQNFDGITYAKGASVLKQLQAYVGLDAFLAGVRRHFAAHAWSTATFDDLLGALAEASGQDLSGWSTQWLKTTGVATLRAHTEVDEAGNYQKFVVEQDSRTLRTHRITIGLYKKVDSGAVVCTRRFGVDIHDAETEVPEFIGVAAADLVILNDEDLSYALLDLRPAEYDFLLANMDRLSDPMARALMWGAAWEATRDGRLPAHKFLMLVAKGIGKETELAVVERVLFQANQALRRFADPQCAAGKVLLNKVLRDGAADENPERAIIFLEVLSRCPLTAESIDYLRELLGAGSLDRDNTWKVLTALSAHGALPEGALKAQEAADTSDAGHRSALRTRAAANNASAKQHYWQLLTDPTHTLTNLEVRQLLMGFNAPGDGVTELLAEFTEDYFARAQQLWTANSDAVGRATLEGLYPSWDISERTITLAQGLLADASTAEGLKRIIAEYTDDLARALRVRQVDAAFTREHGEELQV